MLDETWIRFYERDAGLRPWPNWGKAKIVIRRHIIIDDDRLICNDEKIVVPEVNDINYYFWLVIDGEVEFDSTLHFRKSRKQDPRYYDTNEEAERAAVEMLRRIRTHEIGIAYDDVSRAIV